MIQLREILSCSIWRARMSLGRCSQSGRQAGEGYTGGIILAHFIQCLPHSLVGHVTQTFNELVG